MAESWDCEKVITWLKENRLKYWVDAFEKSRDEGIEIDGATLMALDERSLMEDFPKSMAIARKQLLTKVEAIEGPDNGMATRPGLFRKPTHVEVKIPTSMKMLQKQPSLMPLYRQMSIQELKSIAPDSSDAYSDAFKKSHSELFVETPGDLKDAEEDKPKAGPASAEKINQLKQMMSVKINIQDPRTAVHFQMLPPKYNLEVLNRMSTERQGDELDSAQTILGLHTVLRPGEYFKFDSRRGISKVPKPKDESIVKVMRKEYSKVKIPHVKIEGTWIGDMLDDDANLLGGSHRFEVDKIPVDLPIIEADDDIASHFGCKLMRDGDIVTFPEMHRPFPVFCLQIGDQYMEKYILIKELGGGVFLEYHDDNPHFHSPLSKRSDGYVLLGVPTDDRAVGTGKSPLPKLPDPTQKVALKVAGLKIPHGAALYTPPGILHADSACTGRWLIGYDSSDDFSTVLFRTKDDEIAPMNELKLAMG